MNFLLKFGDRFCIKCVIFEMVMLPRNYFIPFLDRFDFAKLSRHAVTSNIPNSSCRQETDQ